MGTDMRDEIRHLVDGRARPVTLHEITELAALTRKGPGTGRRHRRAAAAVAAAAAAGAVAAASLAGLRLGGGPGMTGPAQVRMAAYVISKTERAMAAGPKTAIEEVQVMLGRTEISPGLIYHPNTRGTWHVPDQPSLRARQVTSWSYHGRFRAAGYTAGSALLWDYGSGGRHPAGNMTVDVQARAWWLTRAPGGQGTARPSCDQVDLAVSLAGEVDWSAEIREALSCGQLKYAGRQWVNGVNAIKLVSARARCTADPGLKATVCPVAFHGILWVRPSDYLPLRMVAEKSTAGSWAANFRWLPPTRANRALLRVAIPVRFREIRLPADVQADLVSW